jgi:hypothetical protein
MNTETFAKYKDKLEAIASELGYTLHADMLDSENDWWPWSLVRLMSGTAALPDIHIDETTYGANKGRGQASLCLPADPWGNSVGRDMPSTSFDFSRGSKAIAGQLRKLINSEAYGKALVEIKQRVERHEARVSAALDLSMALKGSKLAFKEAHTNGNNPDHSGDVKMMYYVDNFGTIEIGYGGSYYIKPDATTASAWRIAAAINALLS